MQTEGQRGHRGKGFRDVPHHTLARNEVPQADELLKTRLRPIISGITKLPSKAKNQKLQKMGTLQSINIAGTFAVLFMGHFVLLVAAAEWIRSSFKHAHVAGTPSLFPALFH